MRFVTTLIMASTMAFVSACSDGIDKFEAKSAVVATSVEVTEPALSPKNPLKIKPWKKDATPIEMGYLAAENTKVAKDSATGTLTVEADMVLRNFESEVLQQHRVTLTGKINAEGSAVLKPTTADVKGEMAIRARVTCLSDAEPTSCEEAIIDIFAKENGRIHATQLKATLGKDPSAEATKPSEENTHPTEEVNTEAPQDFAADEEAGDEEETSAPAQESEEKPTKAAVNKSSAMAHHLKGEREYRNQKRDAVATSPVTRSTFPARPEYVATPKKVETKSKVQSTFPARPEVVPVQKKEEPKPVVKSTFPARPEFVAKQGKRLTSKEIQDFARRRQEALEKRRKEAAPKTGRHENRIGEGDGRQVAKPSTFPARPEFVAKQEKALTADEIQAFARRRQEALEKQQKEAAPKVGRNENRIGEGDGRKVAKPSTFPARPEFVAKSAKPAIGNSALKTQREDIAAQRELQAKARADQAKAKAEQEKRDAEAKAKADKAKKDAEAKAKADKAKKDAEAKAKVEKAKKDAEAKAKADKEKLEAEAKAKAEKQKKDAEAKAKADKEKLEAEAKAKADKEKEAEAQPDDQEDRTDLEEEESEEEGVDPEERPSLYVGTLYEGADDLFNDTPAKEEDPNAGLTPDLEDVPTPADRPEEKKDENKEPKKDKDGKTPELPSPPIYSKKRPVDQAIGSANNGRMERASSMLEKENPDGAFTVLRTGRKRHYGTYELVEVIAHIGKYSKKLPVSGSLRVGDLSQQKGGKLANSKHKSHRNGLDVDLGYPVRGESNFTSVVTAGGAMQDRFSIAETWALFKTAWASKTVDRIFLDQKIKNALCTHAESKGEKKTYTELLRRLRPTPGHKNHWHLRIRCSVYQKRCQMMGDPPTGSGCP